MSLRREVVNQRGEAWNRLVGVLFMYLYVLCIFPLKKQNQYSFKPRRVSCKDVHASLRNQLAVRLHFYVVSFGHLLPLLGGRYPGLHALRRFFHSARALAAVYHAANCLFFEIQESFLTHLTSLFTLLSSPYRQYLCSWPQLFIASSLVKSEG